MQQQDTYRNLDKDTKELFLEINLADEYFKMKSKLEESEQDSDSKSNEIYSLKHEIMSLQAKLDTALAEVEKQKNLYFEEQKNNVRLETELTAEKKRGKADKG